MKAFGEPTDEEQQIERRENGAYFIGDLDKAKREATAYRYVREGVNAEGGYTVELADGEDIDATLAEFGHSKTGNVEEAWRYEVGAYFA